MEFPQLGAHCNIKFCNQLDYLPFQCDSCHLKFCLEHKSPQSHQCKHYVPKERRTQPCPVCSELLVIGKDDNTDEIVANHLEKQCGKAVTKKPLSFACKFKGCKNKEFVSVLCEHCKDNYCFKHRFPTSHKCEYEPKTTTQSPPTSLFKTTPITATTTTKTLVQPTPINVQRQQQQQQDLRSIRERHQASYNAARAPAPVAITTPPTAEINVLLTNGEVLSKTFRCTDQFREVQRYIDAHRTDGKIPYSILAEDNHLFDISDTHLTLKDLNLYPQATLVLIVG
ncbi:hypothetical protein SAMD00019534_012620 [Acytostelium subglobosum LB1]|uniref:hypothetical protein n=1 Tax=Acytostelium subglobosum LB1 TaxID=1410327 RepID=UPI0006451DAD|nr:hypothetical protein SAMD00019534_012620 [Acytostelium subglobosum LB1]GAM18087.1 hypothetical protein SAMD00019534_012620 [Acytostelium subglobosum LB1]|eukprot:XP_012758683.1 hypothetical protein SAMD00019534_012620 [Acytostelium subglobosum LB1]